MIAVALKGLLGRKVRALLTAFAVVIGVAMVSGTLVLTDTIQKAFDGIFTASYAQTDAVIAGKEIVKGSQSGAATIPASLLAKVRALPEVAAAGGAIAPIASNQAEIFGRDGKALGGDGAPQFGLGNDASQPQFSPLQLKAGQWPVGPKQVALDPGTAAAKNFKVGDTVAVSTLGAKRRYEVTGIASFGGVDSLGGATMAIWDLATAQTLLGKEGRFDSISIAAKGGRSADDLVRAVQPLVPASLQVKGSEAQAAADAKETNVIVTVVRYFLLGFGGIALFVGAFVIFNTLSITVAQRTREFATLRTLGASRRQVLRSVVLEGLMIGLLASLVGMVLGIGIAKGMNALFVAFGIDLPNAGTVYATRTFVVSLLLGIVVTVVAGLVPAVRATRIAPIAAARGGLPQKVRSRRATVVGVVLLVVAALLLAYSVTGNRLGSGTSLLALAVGALAFICGTAGVASRLVTLLARVLGWPSRRFGGAAGRIASENAVRNPQRTAATAAALMIGIALASFVAVLGRGVHDSMNNAIDRQFPASWIVTSKNGWSGFPTAAGDAAAHAPGVTHATSIRGDRGLIGNTQVNVNGVDPATVGRLYHFGWKRGSSDATLAELASGGAIVKQSFATKNHLELGEQFVLLGSSGRPVSLHVAGFYEGPRIAELLGGVIVSQDAFATAFPRPQDAFTLLEGSPTKAGLARTLAAYPDTKVQTHAEFVKNATSFMSSLLNLVYVLLALSVIVSLFGMVNTLVLSVWERTREIGMLRAVGMSRRQTRRMVRHESIVTALIGAGLGLPVGIVLAYAVTHALGRFGVEFELSAMSLARFALVAISAGSLAAIAPARRASRLNVLQALQYE